MNLPSLAQIEQLHRKYAPSDAVFDLVYTHCQIVWEIAEQLINTKRLSVDAELVKVGSLLHDIGVYRVLDAAGGKQNDTPYVIHGIKGAEILHAEGYPELIRRFASHHTGLGLSKEDIQAQNLPLPLESFEAETLEELLVMYADKFHTKVDPPYFNTYAWYAEYTKRFGADKPVKFAQLAATFGKPDLAPFARRYRHQIRD